MHWPSFPLFYWMTWAWPNDVIRPRPLRPSTLWHGVLCHSWMGVKRRQNIWERVSCTTCKDQGNDFELILTVKNEIRHPVKGSFGSRFMRSVMALCMELWRPEVARRWNFVRFFFLKNDPLWWNFQNYLLKVFTASPIDFVVF